MLDIGWPQYCACDECPIIDKLERRLRVAEEHQEYGDIRSDHCRCDKVYDKFSWCGYCSDALEDNESMKRQGLRRTGMAYRRKMNRKKHKRKATELESHSGQGWFPYWFPWKYEDGDDVRSRAYFQRSKNSRNKQFWQRVANKKTRKNHDVGRAKCGHKRNFDLWWTLY